MKLFKTRARSRKIDEADASDDATVDASAAGEPHDDEPTDDVGMLVGKIARADRFTFLDLLVEAITDIGSRPGRLVMTILGTVLGIGALVATIGFAQTTAGQIARQFDAVAATQVIITPAEGKAGQGQTVAAGKLPWDGPERMLRLAGVEAAALLADVQLAAGSITAVPVNDPAAAVPASPALVAASGELLEAVRGSVVTGRMFDAGHDERGDRVAVLGTRAAERLGINRVDSRPSIFIDGISYAVIGIFDDVQRRADLLDSVVVPLGAARGDFNIGVPGELQVRIVVGAGPQVAEQAAIALDPGSPESFKITAPAGRSDLGQNVQADVNIVFVILGVVVLLAGGLGIANVTMLSVMERTGEIGLRRALGATRREIAGQFVAESIVIGLLGGLIGASLGVLSVVIGSVLLQWTPVLDPLIALAGVVLGAIVGLVAGGVPARRAARIEPVAALRGGT